MRVELKNAANANLFNEDALMIPIINWKNVYPLIKGLFSPEETSKNVPQAGRMSQFLKSWKILIQNPNILSILVEYKKILPNSSIALDIPNGFPTIT